MHDDRCLKILLWKESAYTCFSPCSFSPDVPGACCPEPCLWGTAVSANPRRAERGAPLRLDETAFPSPSAQPHVFAARRLRPGAEGSRCLRTARRDGRQPWPCPPIPPPPPPGTAPRGTDADSRSGRTAGSESYRPGHLLRPGRGRPEAERAKSRHPDPDPFSRRPSPVLNASCLSSPPPKSWSMETKRTPHEFWMPKTAPLHHMAASITTQPQPPSGGSTAAALPGQPSLPGASVAAGDRAPLSPSGAAGPPLPEHHWPPFSRRDSATAAAGGPGRGAAAAGSPAPCGASCSLTGAILSRGAERARCDTLPARRSRLPPPRPPLPRSPGPPQPLAAGAAGSLRRWLCCRSVGVCACARARRRPPPRRSLALAPAPHTHTRARTRAPTLPAEG